MAKKGIIDRPEFRNWVDGMKSPNWDLMPLTHITKGIVLQDIIRSKSIDPSNCDTLNQDANFFFYGRPAYRVSGDGTIEVEAACPTCLIFNSAMISQADKIHAFDTGAFGKRMYKHILLDEMQLVDFSLGNDTSRPNKLIHRVFGTRLAYFDADTTDALRSDSGAESWEYHAKAYLDLINSPGRNEPDDRVCTIEVVFGGSVDINAHLMAIVVPHTHWSSTKKRHTLKK